MKTPCDDGCVSPDECLGCVHNPEKISLCHVDYVDDFAPKLKHEKGPAAPKPRHRIVWCDNKYFTHFVAHKKYNTIDIVKPAWFQPVNGKGYYA